MYKENLPKYENEQHQEGKEDSHIVHGAQHHKQLTPQIGHKTYQF